jgi:hypothetical protein
VESRKGARSVEERAAEETEQEIMRNEQHVRTQNSQNTQSKVFSAISACSAWMVVITCGAGPQPCDQRAVQDEGSRRDPRFPSPRGALGRIERREARQRLHRRGVAEARREAAAGKSDYRLPFDFTAGTRDGGSTVSIGSQSFATQADVRALSFSDNAEVTGDVVFAGYGIVVPETQDFGYDSYATLDVKDKVVLVLRYFPEDADQKTRAILARYADLRYKALAARQRGAKAIIVVTGPRSPNAGETIPMTFDTALAGSGIVAASISAGVAKAIFGAVPDKNLEAVQKSFDSGNPHVAGFAIPNAAVTIRAAVEREKRTGHNVVAYLPATTPVGAMGKPWVAIGAHYDHLGHGEAGNSLSGKDDAGKVHFGADDNASGSAAVLGVRRRCPNNRASAT